MSTQPIRRSRSATALAGAAIVLIAAGCTGTPAASAVASAVVNATIPPLATEAPTSSPTEEASTTATEAPSETALPSAVATAIDPCQLITADEASKLVGVTFGAGKTITNPGKPNLCTYAAPGPHLFSVEVAVAPDEATAKAAEAHAEQDLKSQGSQLGQMGVKVTELPGFAANTDAAMLEGSVKGSVPLAARAMFLLRGVTFVGFSDVALGGQPPSAQDMQNEAMTVLGRLP